MRKEHTLTLLSIIPAGSPFVTFTRFILDFGFCYLFYVRNLPLIYTMGIYKVQMVILFQGIYILLSIESTIPNGLIDFQSLGKWKLIGN